jgi:hypothetical protein
MTDAIAHRGPDDRATWADAEADVVLGFRRLAILDRSPPGHQPMLSPDGRYVVVFYWRTGLRDRRESTYPPWNAAYGGVLLRPR